MHHCNGKGLKNQEIVIKLPTSYYVSDFLVVGFSDADVTDGKKPKGSTINHLGGGGMVQISTNEIFLLETL